MRRLHFEEPWLTSFIFHPGLVETGMTTAAVADLGSNINIADFGAISVDTSVAGMVKVIHGAAREAEEPSARIWQDVDDREPLSTYSRLLLQASVSLWTPSYLGRIGDPTAPTLEGIDVSETSMVSSPIRPKAGLMHRRGETTKSNSSLARRGAICISFTSRARVKPWKC